MMEIRGFLYSKIEFTDFDVVIPFICARCGLCCKSYVPRFTEKNFCIIQSDMKLEHYSFSQLRHSRISLLKGRHEQCPFLAGCETCLIHGHPLKPDACRLYPFSFEKGENRCPEYEIHIRIVHALTYGETAYEIYDSSFCPNSAIRPIPEKFKYTLLYTFLSVNSNSFLIQPFRLLNGYEALYRGEQTEIQDSQSFIISGKLK